MRMTSSTNVEVRYVSDDDEEAPPTLGVREPRRPYPPTRDSGAEVELHRSDEAEAVAAGASVDD